MGKAVGGRRGGVAGFYSRPGAGLCRLFARSGVRAVASWKLLVKTVLFPFMTQIAAVPEFWRGSIRIIERKMDQFEAQIEAAGL